MGIGGVGEDNMLNNQPGMMHQGIGVRAVKCGVMIFPWVAFISCINIGNILRDQEPLAFREMIAFSIDLIDAFSLGDKMDGVMLINQWPAFMSGVIPGNAPLDDGQALIGQFFDVVSLCIVGQCDLSIS